MRTFIPKALDGLRFVNIYMREKYEGTKIYLCKISLLKVVQVKTFLKWQWIFSLLRGVFHSPIVDNNFTELYYA